MSDISYPPQEFIDRVNRAAESALRDQFAMAALPALIGVLKSGKSLAAEYAADAYAIADAMLAAREKKS